MIKSGYHRMTPHHADDAVSWWFFRTWKDGFAFGRGGRCRTSREARHLITDLYNASEHQHHEWLRRPTHQLLPTGEIEGLPEYSDRLVHSRD